MGEAKDRGGEPRSGEKRRWAEALITDAELILGTAIRKCTTLVAGEKPDDAPTPVVDLDTAWKLAQLAALLEIAAGLWADEDGDDEDDEDDVIPPKAPFSLTTPR